MVLQCQESVSRLAALEAAVLEQPQVALEQFHHFDHGVYQRGMLIPAGVVVTGALHLHENMLTLLKGECLFLGEGEPVRAVAPWSTVNGPGTKRAVYAVTDCVLVSYVQTDSLNPEDIRRLITVNTQEEYLQLQEKP